MGYKVKTVIAGLSALLLLEGCATTPLGPTVQVMPAKNKPFDVFAQEQAVCKQYATQQVSGQADAANERAVGTGIIATALGAGLGAAVGGGHGAGVGAATGAVAGTAIGAGTSSHNQHGIQQQYDNAYAQCMVAKGNQLVPPPAPIVVQPAVIYAAPPPPPPAVIYAPPPAVIYAPPPGTPAP